MERYLERRRECDWLGVDKDGRAALGGGGHPEEKCKELCAPAPTPFECEAQNECSPVGFLPSPSLKPHNFVTF